MRLGMSSRGNVWFSMGCLGWLILGPFILAGYVLVGGIWLVIMAVIGVGRLLVMGVDAISAHRKAAPPAG